MHRTGFDVNPLMCDRTRFHLDPRRPEGAEQARIRLQTDGVLGNGYRQG